MKSLKKYVLLLILCTTANTQVLAQPTVMPQPVVPLQPTGPASIVGSSIIESDHLYPWKVSVGGCGGVLIAPDWVLTAAHCVRDGVVAAKYIRTALNSTSPTTEFRRPAKQVNGLVAVFPHAGYDQILQIGDDIALIKLETAFSPSPIIQVVGLPTTPRTPGIIGSMASISHSSQLSSGKTAVFRAPIPNQNISPNTFDIRAQEANASLCPGDSGSGFVTVENGRATVRGLASTATITNCMTAFGLGTFIDVYYYLPWILETMKLPIDAVVGNTRVRTTGNSVNGVMALACTNPFGTMTAPMHVRGVALGANCEEGFQAVFCSLSSIQSGAMAKQIIGFQLKTTNIAGSSSLVQLPFSPKTAVFHKQLPADSKSEFECKIGKPRVIQ